MSGYSAVGRNTAWLLAGRLVSQAFTILFTVLLAARLGVVGLGEYAFVAAIVFLANVVTTFGTDMVLVREIAAGGPVARWAAALAVQLGLTLGAIGVIWDIRMTRIIIDMIADMGLEKNIIGLLPLDIIND